jgi:competence protein ComEA
MFSRLTDFVRDYFGFSQRETRGFLVLLVLILLLLAAPFLYRWLAPAPKNDTSAADQRKLDSLVALMQTEDTRQEADRKAQYGNRYANSDDKTTSERFAEPKLFNFDPNTASVSQWQQLGLPRYMAERIDKYRSKGGQFRKKEDLLRIYDFPPDLYDQLEPYIQVKGEKGQSGSRFADNASADKPGGPGAGPNRYEKPAYVKPAIQPFDINTADTAQLIALKGIGSGRARQIVKFRDALGGFINTDQFAEIFNIDSLSMSELQQYARIKTEVRKISVNTATAEELDRSPYLSRRQAEIIVRYREQHGAYANAEALKPIRILDAKTIDKIAPYLAF